MYRIYYYILYKIADLFYNKLKILRRNKMSELLIGLAEIDITPNKKVALAGQFAERISEYVEKPLTATAMAVSDGTEQMILVSCDLVYASYNLVCAIRENFKDNQIIIFTCSEREKLALDLLRIPYNLITLEN